MERAREGVAILLNDVWHSAVIDPVICRFSRVKLCVLVEYDTNEGNGEERERL